LHPEDVNQESYVDSCLKIENGPVIAVSDYVKLVAEQIAPYIKCPFIALGTDGFGRSETREELRKFFEINRYYIIMTALESLSNENIIEKQKVTTQPHKSMIYYNI
jgi:pyruvate dehydrogenase E1 component